MSDATRPPRNAHEAAERFTGHGAEWKPANLSPADARIATATTLQ